MFSAITSTVSRAARLRARGPFPVRSLSSVGNTSASYPDAGEAAGGSHSNQLLNEAIDAVTSIPPTLSESTIKKNDLLASFLPEGFTGTKKSTAPLVNIPPEQDPLLRLLSSMVMKGGNRARSDKIISQMLLIIHARTRAPALPIVRQAIFSVSPSVKLRGDMHGTKMVYVPIPLYEKQSIRQGVKWLVDQVLESRVGGFKLEERLAREIINIVRGESEVLKKRETAHRTAMVNRGNLPKVTRAQR